MKKRFSRANYLSLCLRRLKILLLVAFIFMPGIAVCAQANTKIVIANKKTISIQNLLKEIEKDTEYIFFYSDDLLDNLTQTTSVAKGEYTIDEVLNKSLSSSGLSFKRRDNQISLISNRNSSTNVNDRSSDNKHVIKGKVVDEQGDALIGVNVIVDGTTRGVATQPDGTFELKDIELPLQLSFSYLGFNPAKVVLTTNKYVDVVLKENIKEIGEVVVTAWGVEKKTTMVGSISSVRPKELKGPTSNLTTMLAGRVAGLVSYQLSGEPGRDNAEFFVRGISSFGTQTGPLILINGIESTQTDLARIQPDDIEGFSILKDATATSMYGSRGANGVLLITTKAGDIGLTKFSLRYETSVSSNTKDFKLADNITYMNLANQASMTRGGGRIYDPRKIAMTAAGVNPLLYPDNDWREIMIKDNTWNHRVNLNVSGGTERARYYVAGTFKSDNGVLKEHKVNGFDTNVSNTTIEIRSNIDITLTSTTEASVRVSGLFDELKGPGTGTGADVFKSMLKANPVQFPAVYPQSMKPWAKHPLFGSESRAGSESQTDYYYNPFASALSGYSEEATSAITAQFELSQDFKFITPGLKGRMMAYTRRNASDAFARRLSPFYYKSIKDLDQKDVLAGIDVINPDTGTEYLDYSTSGAEYKSVWNENFGEIAFSYDGVFNDVHTVGAVAQGYVREKKISRAASLERSLAQRNVSLSGRLTYGYDNRYLGEFNFGYNASERFSRAHRWGFFPSVGLAWNIAEEEFMSSTSNWLDKLKLRYSYGLVGNDNLTDWFYRGEDRYFYLDMINMSGVGTQNFGINYDKRYDLIKVNRYGNPNITWEKSYKQNVAIEIGLFRGLNVEFDIFRDKRTNILMNRADLPSSMGLEAAVRSNVGKMVSKGFETTVDYNTNINKDMWMSARGTFTYSSNRIKKYEEPNYPESLSYLSAVGRPWGTMHGYIAERLFMDDEDVRNSPSQEKKAQAGDIKYRDVNGDGKIDKNDMVPMGYPTTPEIVYGFGFSFGYKDFDLSAFFQGQARSSFMIDAGAIQPFVKSGGQDNGLLRVIANDHWNEDNQNLYAFYPRLSIDPIENNNLPSSWWLRDGDFIRLKTVEFGYTPKTQWTRKMGLTSVRVYISGMNLLTFSKFKLWDIEMKGNGLGYPLQRVFNGGLQLTF